MIWARSSRRTHTQNTHTTYTHNKHTQYTLHYQVRLVQEFCDLGSLRDAMATGLYNAPGDHSATPQVRLIAGNMCLLQATWLLGFRPR